MEQLEFHVLVDGHLGLDGGAMFGVIPKPMWEKKIPADGRNRITLAMNCLLVRAGGKTILVETGAGDKWDEKRRDIYALDGPHLTERLRDYGVHPHEIDIVINTHLHFDHCGGNTRVEKDKVSRLFRMRDMWFSAANTSTQKIPTSEIEPATFLKITCRSRLRGNGRCCR